MSSKNIRRRLSNSLILFILLPFAVVSFRLLSIQLFPQDRIEDIIRRTWTEERIFKEARGEIYDRKGRELAISIKISSLCAYPEFITSKEALAKELSRILDIPKRTLLKKLSSKGKFVWIKRKITSQEEERVKNLKAKGLGFIKEYKRWYPKGRLAAHLIGFVGLDNYGLEGIEYYFNRYLDGKEKKVMVAKDGYGRVLSKGNIEASKSYDLVLTIDEVIQHIAEVELEKVVKRTRAESGSIIVMNPSTGEILAMAVYPDFNPNHFLKTKSSRWRNRIITDPIEPGSIFKVFAYGAALEEGVVDLEEKIDCQGYTMVSSHRIHCYKRHNTIDLKEALEKSCNPGVINVIMSLSGEKFHRYMRKFGFGTSTGIHLPGESKGLLHNPSKWSGLSQASIGIGQEILVTPLQLAVAFSCFANGGKLMRPFVVKKIVDQDGEVVKRFSPIVIHQVISHETSKKIKEVLAGVVLRGTGQKANIEGYKVYGKTGTAQKYDPFIKGFSKEKFISLFCGWVEGEDGKVMIQVIIDNPKGSYFGGEVAAPLFKKIALKTLSYMNIPPKERNLGERRWTKMLPFKKPSLRENLIPDIRGKTMRAVYKVLSRYDVELLFTGTGIATKQTPPPFTKITPGMKVCVHFDPNP